MTSFQAQIVQHPWFPKTEPPLGGGSQSGVWQVRSRDSLSTIAKSLVYEVSSSRVNSLPSPWSRALQFEQAVLNTQYPTRDLLLEELFGALACIGLWDMFGLRLDAHRVSLREHEKENDDAVGPFARSLLSSLPDGSYSLSRLPEGNHPWDVVYVFQLEGIVIGFSSPSTLFCPAVHLPSEVRGMKWTAGGRFTSPVEFLGAQQRQALGNWIGHVRNGLLTSPDLNSQTTVSQLAQILSRFISELTGSAAGAPTLADRARVQNLPSRPVSLSLLGRPAMGGESISLATIDLGDRARKPVSDTPVNTPVILVDPEMPSKLGIAASDICLYKSATLESIGSDAAQLQKQYGNEIRVLTPEQVFLDQLYLLPGQDALMNSWLQSNLEGSPQVNGDPVTPLLPLQPDVRSLFSSIELQQRCELRVVQAGIASEIEVRLRLPIQGQRDPYTISRTYLLKEENKLGENLPVITLWPYISDNRWNVFYIFCEDNPTGLSVDGFGDYDRSLGQDGQQHVKYFTTPNFPDLVRLCERGKHVGLIPLSPPISLQTNTDSWKVGIDFGTSFTNFFIDSGDGPKRLHLDTRLASLTSSEKQTRRQLLSQYFIPEDMFPIAENGGNPPTATAISLRGWIEVLGQIPELFHQARLRVPIPGEFGGSELRTGFKWEQLQYQKPFLKEVALLISANAATQGASEIQWSVSYPSAFSATEVTTYRRLWVELSKELKSITGITHQLSQNGSDGRLLTEAVAFASYFGNFLNRQMVHTSCLDIGGGTTDISIWQENRLIHQVSIPYAGRDISTHLLKRKPSFVKRLFPPSLTKEINDDEARARQDKNFTSRLDNIMRYGYGDLSNGLYILLNQESAIKTPLAQFIGLIAISYGGLYHYLGIIQRVLRTEGKLSRNIPTPVYVGGNGARLINWIDESTEYQKGGDIDKLFEMLQVKAARCTNGRAATMLSDAYKDETACGLISDGVNLSGDFDPRSDHLISGASVQINELSFGAEDRVESPSGTVITRYLLPDLSSIKEFVHSYDNSLAELGIRHLLPVTKLGSEEHFWQDVELEARSLCAAKEGLDASDLEPEPAFILGLRALTNTLGRIWADRF